MAHNSLHHFTNNIYSISGSTGREFMTIIQADVDTGPGSASATGISVSKMTGERIWWQCDECVSGSRCWVRGTPPPPKCPGSKRANQWSRKTNGHSWRRLAATLPTGADASLYGGLSLTSPEMSLLLFPSSLTAISIVDLSHAGAESLLGVSFFNYLTSPISASLSPPSGQTLHSRRKATKC